MVQRLLLISSILSVVLSGTVLSNPVKNFVVTKDSLGHAVLVKTVPSIKLEEFGDRLYHFEVIFKGNYHVAMQFCKYYDMELLSIESEEENDFLWKHMQSFLGWGEYDFWTSGTTMTNDHWVWLSTGRPISFANWLPNQPDNSGDREECLEVRYSNHNKALMWNDHVCTYAKHVICETTVPKSNKSTSSMVADYPNSCNETVMTVPGE